MGFESAAEEQDVLIAFRDFYTQNRLLLATQYYYHELLKFSSYLMFSFHGGGM